MPSSWVAMNTIGKWSLTLGACARVTAVMCVCVCVCVCVCLSICLSVCLSVTARALAATYHMYMWLHTAYLYSVVKNFQPAP